MCFVGRFFLAVLSQFVTDRGFAKEFFILKIEEDSVGFHKALLKNEGNNFVFIESAL